MSTQSRHWSELEGFRSCTPGKLAFRALAALLETWPSRESRDEAIELAEQILSSWPDSERLAPWSWCKAVTGGVTLATWQLARTLDLTTQHLSKSKVSLANVAEHGGVDHITQIVIPGYSEHKDITYLYNCESKFCSQEPQSRTGELIDLESVEVL